MGYDRAGDSPAYVTVQTPGPHGRPVRARVRREALLATTPRKEAAMTDSKKDTAAEKAPSQDATPHAKWRAEQIKNATNPDTGESIPTDVRAGDPVQVDPSVQTTRGSSAKK